MTTNEVREKYLNFFKNRGHKIISPAPLVLENDPTTLFTSSGMQPLVPNLLGEPHPEGKRVCDSQPSIRVQDIEEVGDNRHTTFFEMLGNWSFGDYFKADQLPWIWEFLTDKKQGLGLDPGKLYVSVFEGNKEVPKDEESITIWEAIYKNVGIDAKEGERIFAYDDSKNWWSRSGTISQMPAGEIGGPDSEVFYDFGEELGLHEKSKWKDEKCHPNCDCGRFLEIGNSVFIQYKKNEDGSLEELPNKNVDFGGGLERLVAATNNDPDIFKIDVFEKMISEIRKVYFRGIYDPATKTPYYPNELKISSSAKESESRKQEIIKNIRIISDHIRASVFLINSGVEPANKLQGYILRRLLRRAVAKAFSLDKDFDSKKFRSIAKSIMSMYPEIFDVKAQENVEIAISLEVRKFRATYERGLKEFDKFYGHMFGEVGKPETKKPFVYPGDAFMFYERFGFPVEIFIEVAKEKGLMLGAIDMKDKNFIWEFNENFKNHQNKSRTASAGVFKGGLADHSEETTQLHTITHLLHAALRKVLGEHVSQKGSNITGERLRFDFSHPEKLTDEEIKKVETLVNEQIDKKLPVSYETKTLKEAQTEGALAFFSQKYDEKVKVYTIGDPQGEWFSKEVCGGPHVGNLAEIHGHVRIIKEQAASAGVRRVYANIA